jgi:hypothetical protein
MVKDLAIDFTHLPSKENLFWAGIGGGLALAVHPADEPVNQAMVNSDFAHDFFKFGSYLGELYTLLPTAVTVYAVGRAKDQPKVPHMGAGLIQPPRSARVTPPETPPAERPMGGKDLLRHG